MLLSRSLRRVALALVVTLSLVISINAQTGRGKTVRVTLLQVNDVYQISPVDKGKNGGLARLATLRKRVAAESANTLFITSNHGTPLFAVDAAESANTLFLLAGDTLSPSVASHIFKGEQMIAGWNAAGLDYAALGNHEFDFGPEILLERMKSSKFVWLAANVVDRRTGRSFGGMPPFVIRNFNGVKVGLFGLLTPETAKASSPGKDVRFLDPYKTAARVVRQLRARGAKVVIAITHLAMPEDKRLAKSARIDVIIGGHEHEVLQAHSGGTPIFKMGSDARLLGRIDLNISTRSGRIENIDFTAIPVNDTVPDDPAAAAVIGEYEKKLSAQLDQPVGRTTVELDAKQQTSRSRETNLGSYIADAFRRALAADVVIFNGGSIRSNSTFGPGPLTRRDVLTMLPFETPIVKVEVTGTMIRAALEHGVARIVEETESGRFPQVSGLQFTYDGRRPAGARIMAVTVNGQSLDDQKTYTLASGTYLLKGGDGYTMFQKARYLITAEEAKVDAVILGDAIIAAGEIAPQPDGRIKRLDAPGGR